jgi:hypothetical protein
MGEGEGGFLFREDDAYIGMELPASVAKAPEEAKAAAHL